MGGGNDIHHNVICVKFTIETNKKSHTNWVKCIYFYVLKLD